DKYSQDVMERAAGALLDYTERCARAGISRIPDGSYAFKSEFDSNVFKDILELTVRIEVKGDEMFVDFPDAPPQVPAGINLVYTGLLATVYFAVKSLLDPDIPTNAGFHRPIHVSAPKGSILNAVALAAVYSRTEI